ncbi:hypothetical protein EDD55_105200 [Varunaivibrio sulfuroxidans]|uniref:DUF839 domain-containing protein n=2 Tax=Varunaivibrio sulfuroxidans TaxID=1773489 RepID=A0A4R3JAI7_9PROT|nr:hypothetical protein EDD55_105200 [Varunaivibrio sulfuroxidans]
MQRTIKNFMAAGIFSAGALMSSSALAAGGVAAVEFIGMPAPTTAAKMTKTYSDAKVEVRYADGRVETKNLDYVTLFNNIDKVGSNPNEAGQLYDVKGAPIKDMNGDPVVAETPDANSLLMLPGGDVYLVTHWEYDWLLKNGEIAYKAKNWYSRMPMSMSLTKISQDVASGRLKAVDQSNVDFSGVGGLWIPCAGSQSPWNTHLGSEEDYDLFKRSKVDKAIKGLSDLYFDGQKKANPYQYGHIVEVSVNPGGETQVVKHFAMGRASWEKSRVLSDERTVYFGDDGAYTGLFMFIADRPGDLSVGTLYAAKWNQVSDKHAGEAKLTWIRLGHGSDSEIEKLANQEKFSGSESTIFEFADEPKPGFKRIRAGLKKKDEFVRLRPGKEKAAAFLESRRYAAYLGATTEFNKMEGVAFDPTNRTVYIAMSYMEKGMTPHDGGPKDDIRIPKLKAGATFALTLDRGVKDSEGRPIDSDLVAVYMGGVPELVGVDMAKMDAMGNSAELNKVANPDNLYFSDKMRTLFIGEDSGMHANNYLWAFNVDSRKLSRILSTPIGAESTGLQVVENLGGHAYIMSNFQHAGERVDVADKALKAEIMQRTDRQKASVGYIGGIPGL